MALARKTNLALKVFDPIWTIQRKHYVVESVPFCQLLVFSRSDKAVDPGDCRISEKVRDVPC
jgi:hypothetical protein